MSSSIQAIGAIFAGKRALHLEPAELAFLVAILATSRTEIVPELSDAAMEDLFVQVKTASDPTAENPRRSATNAIQSLRQQGLVARIDSAGMSAAGTFALTALGTAIAASFLDTEVLDRTNLSALGGALRSHLGVALERASRATKPDDWVVVVHDLRTTGHELVGGITRRTLGMDAEQEQIRTTIGELLENDWFGAVARCERLLDETAATLAELGHILNRDGTDLARLLERIVELAELAYATDAREAATELVRRIDRMTAWSALRQLAWSDYYQRVQRYLRDVVRLDPARALSQRLRDTLRAYPDHDWCFVAAKPAHVRLLRAVEPPRSSTVLSREHRPTPPIEVVAPEQAVTFEPEVRAALERGETSLVAIVRSILPTLPEDKRFGAIGRITAMVARLNDGDLRTAEPPRWHSVERFEMQDWEL